MTDQYTVTIRWTCGRCGSVIVIESASDGAAATMTRLGGPGGCDHCRRLEASGFNLSVEVSR